MGHDMACKLTCKSKLFAKILWDRAGLGCFVASICINAGGSGLPPLPERTDKRLPINTPAPPKYGETDCQTWEAATLGKSDIGMRNNDTSNGDASGNDSALVHEVMKPKP